MYQVQRPIFIFAAIAMGIALRFWHLDLKPVWMDEVMTAILSLGRNYQDVPLGQVLPVSAFEQVFRLRTDVSCADIAHIVTTQSVHPPFFFCWMHDWLRWTAGLPLSWIWKLRALPALFGVLVIVAMYQLNRVLYSRPAAWAGAAVMAVSPLAVYLSQEARHYTLPVLLITLALLGLYQLHLDLYRRQLRPLVWLGWVVINGIGFYVHYFFLLAFVAECLTLLLNSYWLFRHASVTAAPLVLNPDALPDPSLMRQSHRWQSTLLAAAIGVAIGAVCLIYLPLLPTFLSHINRPETDWMVPPEPGWLAQIAPLYQLPFGWIVMLIALPVESQPLSVRGVSAVAMVSFTGWLLWRLWPGLKQLWYTPQTHLPTRMLVIFILTAVLEFLAIVYLLQKDITQVPRYHFIYFPAVCALLGAGLSQSTTQRRPLFNQKPGLLSRINPTVALLLVGLLSSSFVVTNLVFQKPYTPEQVVQTMRFEPTRPLLVSMGHETLQEVALGLSFTLELERQHRQQTTIAPEPSFVFLNRSLQPAIWQRLATITASIPSSLNLWVIGPGLKRGDFPAFILNRPGARQSAQCQIDRLHYHRVGVPYQLYRC